MSKTFNAGMERKSYYYQAIQGTVNLRKVQ